MDQNNIQGMCFRHVFICFYIVEVQSQSSGPLKFCFEVERSRTYLDIMISVKDTVKTNCFRFETLRNLKYNIS
jgi:hypothetical protein